MNKNVIDAIAVEGIETVKQEGDITMKYTFRKLNSTDVFLMFKIIGKIGINDITSSFDKGTVNGVIQSAKDGGNPLAGISFILDVANVIITNLPKCENEIYQMLSNTSNLSVEQVKALDFATFTEMVIDFVKKEEFKDFIKVVSKSFKLGN